MNISLSLETQRLIEQCMRNGGYSTPDEMVRMALTTFDQREQMFGLGEAEMDLLYPDMKREVSDGLAAIETGMFANGAMRFNELEREGTGH